MDVLRSEIDLPPFLALPIELLLKVIKLLPLTACLRLAATCRFFDFARSRGIFREFLKLLLPTLELDESTSYRDQLELLVQTAKGHLGWYLSSLPHQSRIIKIDALYKSNLLTLRVQELEAHNDLVTDLSAEQLPARVTVLSSPVAEPFVLPLGAIYIPRFGSYNSPSEGPGSVQPDAGLSVDLFNPAYTFSTLLEVNLEGSNLYQTISRIPGAPIPDPTAMKISLENISKTLVGLDDQVDARSSSGRDAENLFSLFVGRAPKRAWPTRSLIGDWSATGSEFFSGALIGRQDYINGRDARDIPLVDGVVEGFQFRFVRKTILKRNGRLSVAPFLGVEGPPDFQQPNNMIRSAQALPNGGFHFTLAGMDSPVISPPAEDEEVGAELIQADHEQFFPINNPLTCIDDKGVNSVGEILLKSLEGVWAGTYGPHGNEFVQLSVKFRKIAEDSALGDIPIALAPPSPSIETFSLSSLPRGRYKRTLEAVKLTGDVNVPSGETTWVAQLGEVDVDTEGAELPYGIVQSITNADLIERSKDTSNSPLRSEPGVPGMGRIALAGFIQASWTGATLTFIRSSSQIDVRDTASTDDIIKSKTIKVDSCEEIRLRWAELGKVGNFRRVRVLPGHC